MKKWYVLNIFSFLTAFSLNANAIDDPIAPDPTALIELQNIVTSSFQPARYDEGHDFQETDQRIRGILEQRPRQEGTICILPGQLIVKVLRCLDAKTLHLGIALTCHFFNAVTKIPGLYLNEYCLTETIPHSISPNTLRSKTANTKDGVFRLAALYSVTEQDLHQWFDVDCLRVALRRRDVPVTLEGQTDAELDNLYPLFKVVLAANPQTGVSSPQRDCIFQLLRVYSHPSTGLTLNKLRLLTLSPDLEVYYSALERLFFHLTSNTDPRSFTTPEHLPMGVVARQLLIGGRKVGWVNNQYYVNNTEQKEVAIQVIQWCLKHAWHVQDFSILIHDALALECSELAFQGLQKIIVCPDNEHTASYKVRSFVSVMDDSRAQKQIMEFSIGLYERHWRNLSPHDKKNALRLIVRTPDNNEVRSAVADLLSQPGEALLLDSDIRFIDDLYTHGYSQEANTLVQYFLDLDQRKLLLFIIQYNISIRSFFDHAIKIDRAKSISTLKALAESGDAEEATKLKALIFLAKHEPANEADYIMRQASLLNQEKLNSDCAYEFCHLYYYLNKLELFQLYYQKMIDEMLRHTHQCDPEMLKQCKARGIMIDSLEELKSQNPFEIMKLFLAEEAGGQSPADAAR